MYSVTLDHLLKQENTVLEFWTTRKRKLDQCQQFVLLENSAKQVCDLIVRCLSIAAGNAAITVCSQLLYICVDTSSSRR
jgi:hypothetical protein